MKFYKESEKEELELINKYPKAYLIFRFLVRNMDDSNAVIVSREAISDYLNISTRSIDRGINFLKESKYIKITRSGRANIYHINSSIVSVQSEYTGNGCKFSCSVVLSKKELNLNGKSFYDIK